jgi:hypothetical protein
MRPRVDVGLEEIILRMNAVRTLLELAADQAAHDLEDRGNVIFGLVHVFGARHAQPRHIFTQGGQRLFVQKSRQIVAAEGQQFAAAQSDEEVMEFAVDLRGAEG